MMTDQELIELEALCEKATPGPWETFPEAHDFDEFTGKDKDGQNVAQVIMEG
ncbi:MAG: hypothetical protein LBB60_04205 [Desulfovibrio sp.]|jgi:hypothetical protein|nr:hypothetical protein [Desulfovibrio sp.]